ncbi:Mitochondrial inner membrane protease subunit 1 [Linum perenne]
MLPTLNYSGDVLLIEHLSHRLGKLEPGDIVLVRSPVEPRKIVAKRIVGMEGDRVTFLADPSHIAALKFECGQVPKGHVWIQGDNVYASADSRYFGPVPYGLIQGRAFLRVTISILSILSLLDFLF